ncbi:MAG TPA: SCO family protein [Bryobacteraceae bacterium]|nr:SCO family protein [Bryobacteraceae bacterium]
MKKYYLAAAVLLIGCGREKPLPVYGQIPGFVLTNQQGHMFDRHRLDGHVWIADFIYTHCEGPCPRMSSHMHQLQDKVAKDVKLISFSVDPERDTPPVLEDYAKQFGADEDHWNFLTGDAQVLNMLDHDAFKLGSLGAGMDHSTRFVLVDRKGQIRGYYGIAEGDPVEKLAHDAAALEKEQA